MRNDTAKTIGNLAIAGGALFLVKTLWDLFNESKTEQTADVPDDIIIEEGVTAGKNKVVRIGSKPKRDEEHVVRIGSKPKRDEEHVVVRRDVLTIGAIFGGLMVYSKGYKKGVVNTIKRNHHLVDRWKTECESLRREVIETSRKLGLKREQLDKALDTINRLAKEKEVL